MNVFEDLVVELKEENLLEETFIDMPGRPRYDELADDDVLASEEISMPDEPLIERFGGDSTWNDHATLRNSGRLAPESIPGPLNFGINATYGTTPSGFDANAAPEPTRTPAAYEANAVPETTPGPAGSETKSFHSPMPVPDAGTLADSPRTETAVHNIDGVGESLQNRKLNSEREFFKKRAAAEMTSLKMVDAVLSAVEREHLKVVPRTYDDLDAKKALHAFMQVAEDISGEESKQAEFKLLHETELWCSALGVRDKNITVGHLRVYCENCKPMLSSQAMLALARFYRNLPYSEAVRSKFDFIFTRLFSRPRDHDRRELLFSQNDMLGHVKTLYADWSSIPLYSADEDDSNVLLTALSFEELAFEAETASDFDDLIRSDFFGRLRLFKESISELFFAPAVTVAAVDCNIRVGNMYVELISRERQKMDADSIHLRFGELDDQTVSEAAGRSLGLLDVLREQAKLPANELTPVVADDHAPVQVNEDLSHRKTEKKPHVERVVNKNSFGYRLKQNLRSVNKIFVSFAFLLVAASMGVYIWANYFAEAKVSTAGVKTLSFQGTDLNEQVKTARLSGDTLYILAQPSFAEMTKDKQTDILQRFYQEGRDKKGWDKVNLMNDKGHTVGFASATRLETYP
jgi:hypothetical protein